jgi:hypothetical protein
VVEESHSNAKVRKAVGSCRLSVGGRRSAVFGRQLSVADNLFFRAIIQRKVTVRHLGVKKRELIGFIFFVALVIGCKPSSVSGESHKSISQVNKNFGKINWNTNTDFIISPKTDTVDDSEESTTSLSELNDSVLLCYDGAFPFYVACEDSSGAETIFYADGKIKAKGKCVAGKKSGMWISYFENGNVLSKGIIKNGFPLGEWVFYYSNGNKKAEGELFRDNLNWDVGKAKISRQ